MYFTFQVFKFIIKAMHSSQIRHIVKIALDTVLPPRCVITGDIVERQGMLSGAAWGNLRFISDPQCAICGIPFEFDSEMVETPSKTVCVDCLQTPPPFNKHRAALIYNDASRDLILSFKHGDQTHLVKTFIPLLQKAGADLWTDADVIMPVPLHRWRLLKRRYNQSALLAAGLSKEIKKRTLLDGLIRTRATPSQGHLKRDQRAKNVRRAFAVPVKYKGMIDGKTIVLIDDVYTTGATLKECAKTLKKAGAKTVHAITLARVVRHIE
jgi:ComF family protein